MKHTIDILDKCIDELRQGKAPDECLAVYPDVAADLSPLLRTAAFVRSAPKVQASEATMRAGKIAFLQEAARLRAAKQKTPAKPWQRLAFVASSTFILPQRRALAWTPAISIVLAFVLILCTCTTAIAASRSLPDEQLYGVKLAGEQVQMALTTDPIARADLALSHTETRLDEIATLSNQGRPVDAPAIERLTTESTQALTSIGRIEDDAMKPRLQRYVGLAAQQQAVLNQVQGVPGITEALAAAIAVVQENERLAASAINDPSVLKDPAQRTGRGIIAAPKDTPTMLPTPDPRRMRTPVPAATLTASPTAQPTVTNTAVPATPTLTNTTVPPTPTVGVSVTATIPPTRCRKFSLAACEKIGASEWVIDGKVVRIDAQTKIEGPGAARADVVAVSQAGQPLLAIAIKVHPATEQPVNTVTVRGIILSMSPAQWNIGGQTVALDGNTAIMGTPALGAIAEATAVRKNADALIATSIAIRGAAPEVQLSGVIDRITLQSWVIGGQALSVVQGLTSVSGTPAVGNYASVVALRTDSGALIAKVITIQATPVEEEFEGVINRIDGNGWTINGRRVVRDANTQVDESQARAQVGLRVRVRGDLQGDGSILAITVRILAAGGTGRQASPTVVVSPTILPSITVPPTATRSPIASPTITSPIATPTPTVPQPRLSPTAATGVRLPLPTVQR